MTAGKIPAELKYAKTHEWVKVEGNRATVGITDHAQSELTDIVFVDLPSVGKPVESGKVVLSLESVKTVSDVYAPGSGRVVEVNAELKAHPELVNQDPYGKGWLFRLELAKGLDPSLLDAEGYRRIVGGPG
ncbi:MAG TPA: glycine cleavage system protein GcvH [Thermoplasmata archaeon]|nr:glycine cleavage system protein GcvH [Thermoplasmata archaeon]